MKRDRTLHEHETYLRDGASSVNIATSGRVHAFPIARRGIFHTTTFNIVLAGRNLLANQHQFGNGAGQLHLQLMRKDALGVTWDRYAHRRYSLSAGEWLSHGSGPAVRVRREALEAGPNSRTGVLEPSFHQDFASLNSFPFNNWINPGPHWVSAPIPLENDAIVTVAWTMEDTPDEAGVELDSYRVDLLVQTANADGTTTIRQLCLTHWDSAPAPADPLPAPRTVPVDRTSATPFGTPIPDVLRVRKRDVFLAGASGSEILYGTEARLMVFFDAADRRATQLLHKDDLHLRPPGFKEVALYCAFAGEQPGQGRRRAGLFRSLRELSEFCGGIADISRASAFNGNEDLVYLTLRLRGDFVTTWRDQLTAAFTPDGGGANPLSLLEIRAKDATVSYRDT